MCFNVYPKGTGMYLVNLSHHTVPTSLPQYCRIERKNERQNEISSKYNVIRCRHGRDNVQKKKKIIAARL